jgi:hypothetical protein
MSLTYDVFINEPPQDNGLLPNGEPKGARRSRAR